MQVAGKSAGSVSEHVNPFQIAQAQIDKAAALLNLEPSVHQILREPAREVHVSVPYRTDSGEVRVCKGFRVLYNNARGPGKGGIRFHPEETIDTVRALAAWMTWKTALVDIPLGGSKGGIICNPREMSASELESLSRSYINQIWMVVGPGKDVPAPDVYTTPQIMAWMMDEYCKLSGEHVPGMITGKPLELGGSEGRGDATARGAMYTIREAAKHLGVNLKDSTVAVQGYGNAGAWAAKLMVELFGSRIVAVSDSRGGIYNSKGLDPKAVEAHKQKTGSVVGFPGTEPVTNEELLELNVEVLLPSALEDVITEKNADRVKAKIIGEAANGPTTLEADDILANNGKFVIPDFLCNAGGVTVSYFETVQNTYGYYWEEADVHQRLEKKMVRAFNSTLSMAQEKKVDMRTAAYLVAMKRVVDAMRIRGWV